MAGRFFEQLLESNWQKGKKAKRSMTLPVSIAVHVVVLGAVVVVPLMSWGELPEPDQGAVRAFFVDSAPAPPPAAASSGAAQGRDAAARGAPATDEGSDRGAEVHRAGRGAAEDPGSGRGRRRQ